MTEPQTDTNCLFCRIVSGAVPATVVHESDHTFAFRDLDPQAPTHVLVVPRRHIPTVAALTTEAPEELTALMTAVSEVAQQERLEGGYRTVFNTGKDAQQSVFHAHVHVLGGRPMSWPPG
jgi:histidine triad (HIT) family protein